MVSSIEKVHFSVHPKRETSRNRASAALLKCPSSLGIPEMAKAKVRMVRKTTPKHRTTWGDWYDMVRFKNCVRLYWFKFIFHGFQGSFLKVVWLLPLVLYIVWGICFNMFQPPRVQQERNCQETCSPACRHRTRYSLFFFGVPACSHVFHYI